MGIASLALSVFAVLVAGASAFYTRRQANYARRQADEARQQADEAAKVTVIEQGRLHTELTPQITLVGKARDAEGKSAEVVLELTGPDGLDRLDRVQVRIRDDMPRKPTPAGVLQVTEHWDEVIWVPTGSSPACGTPTPTAGPTGRSRCPRTSPTQSRLRRAPRRRGRRTGNPGATSTGALLSALRSPASATPTAPGSSPARSRSRSLARPRHRNPPTAGAPPTSVGVMADNTGVTLLRGFEASERFLARTGRRDMDRPLGPAEDIGGSARRAGQRRRHPAQPRR